MAKISDLSKVVSPSDSNVFPISDGQTTKKITFLDLKSAINSVATADTVGTIRIGTGLEINDVGIVSVKGYSGYVLPTATTETLGGVIVGEGLSLSGTGVLNNDYSLPTASPTVLGGVKVGSGLTISNGVLSTIPIVTDQFSDSGFIMGNDLDMKIFIEGGDTPTIKEDQNGRMVFAVKDASMPGGYAEIRLLSKDLMVALGGEEAPGLIPNLSGQPVNLGNPNIKWNKVYANQFIGNVVGGSTTSLQSGLLELDGQYVSASTSTSANTIVARDTNGDVTANTFIGDVIGNVNGNANTATQLLTSKLINGEPFNGTQNITITATTPFSLTRGNYITGGSSTFDGSSESTWNVNATNIATPNTIVARDNNGSFIVNTITANNVIGPVTGNVTGNLNGIASSATKLQTPVLINGVQFDGTQNITLVDSTKLPVSGGSLSGPLYLNDSPVTTLQAATKGYADTKLSLSGGTLTGYLTLHSSPVNANHAATKSYVDTQVSSVINLTYTYGNTVYSTSGFTNQVGSFNNGANYFDVFPPAGKTMANLVAFIPSIAIIHYAGGVDGNDSLRCTWSNQGDRIRVYVQNTEQRSAPAANYLAIWS